MEENKNINVEQTPALEEVESKYSALTSSRS